jgi:hypothetical protein
MSVHSIATPDFNNASYEHFVSPADAVALLSHQLYNALSKHKKELLEEIDQNISLQHYEKPTSSVALLCLAYLVIRFLLHSSCPYKTFRTGLV